VRFKFYSSPLKIGILSQLTTINDARTEVKNPRIAIFRRSNRPIAQSLNCLTGFLGFPFSTTSRHWR